MSSITPGQESQWSQGQLVHFPDFEVSWAGANPLNKGYCFGSEDGRLMTTSIDFRNAPPYPKVAASEEAVNGVACAGRTIAVSTRCDVTFTEINHSQSRQAAICTYEGGAHHVISTGSGGFLAPLGPYGLLRMKPTPGYEQSMSILDLNEKTANFYKIAYLTGDSSTERVAVAARRDGLGILQLASDGTAGSSDSVRFFKPPGFDAVDVCSLGSPRWPRAMAGLGADGTIYLCRDVLEDQEPEGFTIGDMQGSAYSIMHDEGHLIVLMKDRIFMLSNLATCYLAGDDRFTGFTTTNFPETAVDIGLAYHNLLIMVEDGIKVLPLGQLVRNSTTSHSVPTKAADSSWNPPMGLVWTPAVVA